VKRIAVISIIVEKLNSASVVNELLHEYSELIVGRMGLPLKEYQTSVITVVCLGGNNDISALSGKLGRIDGINVKVAYSAASFPEEDENTKENENE
jgi:hypothetical protein